MPSMSDVSGRIPTTLEGPFKPVTVRLQDESFRGNAVDLPETDRRVQRTVAGFEPEQISVSLSAKHDSVWVSWITGMYLSIARLLPPRHTHVYIHTYIYVALCLRSESVRGGRGGGGGGGSPPLGSNSYMTQGVRFEIWCCAELGSASSCRPQSIYIGRARKNLRRRLGIDACPVFVRLMAGR